MALAYRIGFLEIPNILQEERLFLHLVFVANDASDVGRWDPQDSVADVRDQFTTFRRRGHIDCVLVLNVVVLTLRRNAPGTQTGDFSAGIVVDVYDAMLSAFSPENFVSLAYV